MEYRRTAVGETANMSQRINNGGCQRGGYRCQCGFSVSKRDKWRRHVRHCELAEEVTTGTPPSSPGRTLGGSSREGRRGGGGGSGGGGGGVVDTNTRVPDVRQGGQEQGK